MFLILLLFFICAIRADYFDILQKEYKEVITGKVRRFYITAEEEVWDYASQIANNTNVPDANKIGTRYYKAIYHEYEDISYSKRIEKPLWQGNMGPVLRVEVGDIIQIFFWNKASRNYTIHPHGVFYEFEMEGAIFKDSFGESTVLPNHNYTYTWNVLPRAGPGPTDGNSLVWGYHSHVTENDIYAGLYGAIVVYRPGTLSDKEIVTTVFVADESLSPYTSKTMTELYPNTNLPDNEYIQAHQFYSINGLISSSPKDLVLVQQHTDWHLIGWGTYTDLKKMEWKDAKVQVYDRTVDSVRLMPASFYTAKITPNKKSGQFKFGAFDYEKDGMVMTYRVDNN